MTRAAKRVARNAPVTLLSIIFRQTSTSTYVMGATSTGDQGHLSRQSARCEHGSSAAALRGASSVRIGLGEDPLCSPSRNLRIAGFEPVVQHFVRVLAQVGWMQRRALLGPGKLDGVAGNGHFPPRRIVEPDDHLAGSDVRAAEDVIDVIHIRRRY